MLKNEKEKVKIVYCMLKKKTEPNKVLERESFPVPKKVEESLKKRKSRPKGKTLVAPQKLLKQSYTLLRIAPYLAYIDSPDQGATR